MGFELGKQLNVLIRRLKDHSRRSIEDSGLKVIQLKNLPRRIISVCGLEIVLVIF